MNKKLTKEPELEIIWWTNTSKRFYKCSKFEECGEIIRSGRFGLEKSTGKRFCERHCPLGDLYMKEYQPKEYNEHVNRCKKWGWSTESPSKL